MNLIQIENVKRQCDRLFDQAARAWERGNNSGDNERMAFFEKRCEGYRREAERLLQPFGITCDYPGLFPSFTVNGFQEHSLERAMAEAIEITVKHSAAGA